MSRTTFVCVTSLCIACLFPTRNSFNERIQADLISLLDDNEGHSRLFLRQVRFEFRKTWGRSFNAFPLRPSYFDTFPILENALLACRESIQVEISLPGKIRMEGVSRTLDHLLGSTIFRRLHELGRLTVTQVVQLECECWLHYFESM